MRNPANTYYSQDQDILFVMTTPEEERALWVKAKDEGNEKAKEFLIKNHLLFAMMQAEKMVAGRLPRNEMTSAANFAVMKAYEKFEYQRGFRFTTYLRAFIKGEVSALWRSKFSGGIPDPSLGGPGNGPAWDSPRLSVHDYSCYENTRAEDTRKNCPTEIEDHPAEKLDLARFNGAALVASMKGLSKKDAALIRMVYLQGKNFADVARARGVSRAAVQATHTKIMGKLKRALKKNGVTEI